MRSRARGSEPRDAASSCSPPGGPQCRPYSKRAIPTELTSTDELLRATLGRAAARPLPRVHLPPAVPRRLHLPRRDRARPVPARPGRHPRLRLALPQGPARQHARLRRHRPLPPQPRGRHRSRLRRLGRGTARRTACRHILDTVPNHVGVATNDNAWWNDVLENGPASPYADYFDIAWRRLAAAGAARQGAAAGPRRPLRRRAGKGRAATGVRGRRVRRRLLRPPLPGRRRRRRFRPPTRRQPSPASTANPATRAASTASTTARPPVITASPTGGSRPTRSTTAASSTSTTWPPCRMERPEVFEQTHALTLRLLAEGKVAGLRIDHPDGLYDPEQYFRAPPARIRPGRRPRDRVRDRTERFAGPTGTSSSRPCASVDSDREIPRAAATAAGRSTSSAEKILAADEPLPPDWAVHGTSGYDFLNMVNGLFVDRRRRGRTHRRSTGTWSATTRRSPTWSTARRSADPAISLASELHMLARRARPPGPEATATPATSRSTACATPCAR